MGEGAPTAGAVPPPPPLTPRRRVHDVLDPALPTRLDALVHRGLILLALAAVLGVVLGTVPSVVARHGPALAALEAAAVLVFAAEYALRLWSAAELPEDARPEAAHLGPRAAYALSPAGVVDLLAIAPFALVGDLLGDPGGAAGLLGLLRLLKLGRYSSGLASLGEVLARERRVLGACLLIVLGLVLLTAALVHLAERGAQPDRFGTLPDAMWWAVATLTTVGYGDAVPVTPPGKLLAGLTAVLGLVLLALPVGIIASGFSEVIHRREFVVTFSMVARLPLFRGLDGAAVGEALDLLTSRSARAGEVVARRGERARALFVVVDGEVEVEMQGRPNARLGPGEVFGERALLGGAPRGATVRAVHETRLLVLEAQDAERLIDRAPEVGERLRALAAERGGP